MYHNLANTNIDSVADYYCFKVSKNGVLTEFTSSAYSYRTRVYVLLSFSLHREMWHQNERHTIYAVIRVTGTIPVAYTKTFDVHDTIVDCRN